MSKTARRTSSEKKTKSKARTRKSKPASRKAKPSKSPDKKKTVIRNGKEVELPQEWWDHQFKPGQSGNPNGRPKGPQITTLRQKDFQRLAKDVPYAEGACKELGLDPKTATLGEVAAAAANMQALIGNSNYYRENLNRDEGKVPDVVLDGNRLEGLMSHLDDKALADLAEKLANGVPKKKKKRGSK
jgi:hypothetical protein